MRDALLLGGLGCLVAAIGVLLWIIWYLRRLW